MKLSRVVLAFLVTLIPHQAFAVAGNSDRCAQILKMVGFKTNALTNQALRELMQGQRAQLTVTLYLRHETPWEEISTAMKTHLGEKVMKTFSILYFDQVVMMTVELTPPDTEGFLRFSKEKLVRGFSVGSKRALREEK